MAIRRGGFRLLLVYLALAVPAALAGHFAELSNAGPCPTVVEVREGQSIEQWHAERERRAGLDASLAQISIDPSDLRDWLDQTAVCRAQFPPADPPPPASSRMVALSPDEIRQCESARASNTFVARNFLWLIIFPPALLAIWLAWRVALSVARWVLAGFKA